MHSRVCPFMTTEELYSTVRRELGHPGSSTAVQKLALHLSVEYIQDSPL